MLQRRRLRVLRKQPEDRCEENITRSCDRGEAPEAHEDAKNDEDVIDATDFACPCWVTHCFTNFFAVLDDRDTESDAEKSEEKRHGNLQKSVELRHEIRL